MLGLGEPPLRRRYALALACGAAVALLAVWALVGGPLRARAARPRPDAPTRAPAPVAVELARPAPESEDPLAARARALAEAESTPPPPAAPPGAPGAEPVSVAHSVGEEDVLDVLVLDAAGAAAPEVPVLLELETEPFSRGPGPTPRVTDANGRTSIPLAWFARPSLGGIVRYKHVLRARVSLQAAPSIDFGASIPGPGPVTLVLPPAGRLLVHVNDAEGAPIARGASVYAVVRPAVVRPPPAPSAPVSAASEVREGLAEFRWIDLDSRLELRAAFDDQRAPSARTTIAGPHGIGETVEETLVLGPEWPLLRFRAVDERGAALVHADLRLRVRQAPLSPQEASCVLDDEGRGELRLLGRHRVDHARTLELEVERPVPRGAQLLLPPELEHGAATELGDVVLTRR